MSETTTAERAADQARAKTQEVGAQARGRVRDEVDRRSTQAGEQAGSAAQALRQASERLRQDGNEPVAKGMDQVAQRVQSAGSWLQEADGDRILRDVEDFGRRNPLAVVAGGLALGFAASRLLKASSRRRYADAGRSWSGNGHGRRENLGESRLGTTPPPATPPIGTTPPATPPIGTTPPATPPIGATPPTAPPIGTTPPTAQPIGTTPPAPQRTGTTPPAPSTGWREPDVTP